MSDYSLSSAFIDLWATEIKLAFQQHKSLLRDSVRTVTGVGAHNYHFPKLTAASATLNRPALSVLTPAGTTYSTVEATMTKIDCTELIDVEEEVQTNADIRSAYTDSIVYSINTALDNLLITQLTTASDLSASLPTASTLDYKGMAYMGQALSKNFVPLQDDNMRYAVVPPAGMSNIVTDGVMVNNLYIDKGAVMRGFATNVYGFDVIQSNLTLPSSTTGHEAYFYDKRAVGLAIADDVTVRVDYIPNQGAWQFWAHMVAGAVVIDSLGLYKAIVAG